MSTSLEGLLGSVLGSSRGKSPTELLEEKQERSDYSKSKRLAKKLGITIEIDRYSDGGPNTYYVCYDWDEFPSEVGETGFACSWGECLDKLLKIQSRETSLGVWTWV
tara:strand:+ start:189 stop:509 length:321 start_codon:yes stop_codon:yes gene_type:complete